MFSELRFAFRTLFREPLFTLSAVAVLALGMGSTTAIYTLLQNLLLAPLPYADSHRLVWIWNQPRQAGLESQGFIGADLEDFRGIAQSFERVAGMLPGAWSIVTNGQARYVWGARVQPGFFEILGVQPFLGRGFLPEEFHRGREMTAIFSYASWQRYYGGDPGIVGRKIQIEGSTFEIAGIMPADFPLSEEYELLAPFPLESPYTQIRVHMFPAIGKLKSGVSLAQARAETGALDAELARRHPDERAWRIRLVTFSDQASGGLGNTLWILAASVGCVLLMACSNAASLILARGVGRGRQMAVRATLGAGSGRLIRQTLLETGVIALAAGLLGWLAAVASVHLVQVLEPDALPHGRTIRADFGVMAFAFFLSLATGVIFGLLPALRLARVDLRDALQESGRGGTSSRDSHRLRSALVVLEVAAGVVLMTSAGLLARSFRELTRVNRGYDASHALTMTVTFSDPHWGMARRRGFIERLTAELERLPGVAAVGASSSVPLANEGMSLGLWVDTQPVTPDSQIQTDHRAVTPGYFDALRIPLAAGRFFTAADQPESPLVALVNDVFAARFFPAGNTLGRNLLIKDAGRLTSYEVVGIVRGYRDVNLGEPPRSEVFTAFAQTTLRQMTLVLRTAGDPSALAAAASKLVASVDPEVPVHAVSTMEDRERRAVSVLRVRSAVLILFSTVAVLLTSLGLYGVIACGVAARRREFGIRVALGARPGQVCWPVVRSGLQLTLAGLALGLAGAAVAARLLSRFLFGVGAADPPSYLVTVAVMLLVAVVASFLPAWRATQVNPLEALREE